MFLSFIIPIYNCEQYIKQNLDIILSSQLSSDDYEVILVDDGSSDGSAGICKQYADQNRNIRYIYQRNQGPATARNTGLDNAKGDYVWFVDADDRINSELLPRLKNIVDTEEKVDLVSFGYVSEYPDGDQLVTMVEQPCTLNGLQFLQMPHHGSYLWNNIYRREAIGSVRLLDGVSHIEDTCFNQQVIIKFDRVIVLPDIGYYYNRCNVNSISNNRFLRDRVKANNDSLLVYQTLYQEMMRSTNPEHQNFYRKSLHFSVNAHLYTIMRFDNVRTLKKYVSRYRAMGVYPLAPTGNRKGDLFRLVANCPWLMCLMMRIAIFAKKIIGNK